MKREYMLDDVIAAISTPIGTGGIGIVRMSGAGCIALADSIFIGKKKLTEKATHTLSYGKITDGAGGEIIDEVLVSVMKAPHTYTKEDIVEINCHGGSLVTRRVLEAVLKTGARIAQPGEFTKRSFLNGRIALTQAEAVIDLIESKTELSRQAAVNQLEGRLKTAVREMREEILDMIASIEAVIDYPDYDVEEETYGTMEQGAKKLLVDNISAFDEVWTVSHGAGENLRSLGYQGDWRVMPNGVDFARGRVPETDVHAVCRDFDLPENVPVFLFVGRMMWYKGLRITLDALKKLKDGGHPFRMVFVGSGGDKDEVVAYANELGLADRVFFTSPKYDRNVIRAWYCRADLFLFPSTFDTNGLVVREAAACELASVLVRGSCAAEDITDGKNGFLIEENADSMAALLAKLCHEPEVLKRVGRQAQEEIYISWDDAVHRAQRRYEIVIEQYRSCGSAHRRFSDEYYQSLGMCIDVLKRSRERLREQWDAFAEHFQ